jgi:hypothetical protein
MFRKLSLITAVAGLALLVASPAWGQGQPDRSSHAGTVPGTGVEQWQKALEARGEALNGKYGVGQSVQDTGTKQSYLEALAIRAQELNRQHELGTFAGGYIDAGERAIRVHRAVGTTPYEQALSARSQELNRRHQLGEFRGTDGFVSGDDHVRLDPSDLPTYVVTTSSGREVEWPQIGIGFGFGIVLMFGVALALRVTRIRPLAH